MLCAGILASCGGTTSTGGPDDEDGAAEATVEVDASDATQDATTREAEGEEAGPEAALAIDASNAAQEASTGSDAGDAAQEATTAPMDAGVRADATMPDGSPDATTPDGSPDARAGDANADTGSDSESPTVDASPDVAPPSCSPGCPDGNQCVVDDDCASSACTQGICASSIPCGNPCPANTTCIGEAIPVGGEGQTCSMSCAGGSQIATITDVYATNCNPTECSAAIASCPNDTSCDVTLSNGICGVDPCPGTPKGWSVTITCN